jgi:Zn-dependent peptidase ImmA (M78 family)
MREGALRRRCRRLLRELDVRPPLDVRDLCDRLAASRGKPIRLVPYPIEVPGPFGLWFATDSADFVVFQQETTKPHQDHIILHELGHMIAEHPSDDESTAFVKRRTCYDSEHEREAELIATIILEWASVLDTVHGGRQDPTVDRLGDSLSHHHGWV